MHSKHYTTVALIVAAMGLSACALRGGAPEPEMGESVRHVLREQIYDPNAALNPDPNAVTGGDPVHLDAILEEHRKDVGKQSSGVDAPITINVGS